MTHQEVAEAILDLVAQALISRRNGGIRFTDAGKRELQSIFSTGCRTLGMPDYTVECHFYVVRGRPTCSAVLLFQGVETDAKVHFIDT